MRGDGVFVDGHSHWKGRIGQAAMSFSKYQGGAFSMGEDGPDRGVGLAQVALSLAARVRLVCRSASGAPDHGQAVLIRQENDPAPKFHFLEEGPVRLGMRVAFDLLDEQGHYHGDGRQDIWLYPEGDLHATFNLQVIDRAGHGPISDAFIEVAGHPSYGRLRLGAETLAEGARLALPFGEPLSGRALVLDGNGALAALYWARDQGHVWKVGCDHGPLPPFYASRWPTGMQQWARGGMGWACHGQSAGVVAHLEKSGPRIRLAWLQDASVEPSSEAQATFTATLVVSLAATEKDLERRIAAVQHPLVPEVDGGAFRCYTEEDGAYEIGQGDPTRVQITFPPDPYERPVRLRFFRRKTDPRHRGGVIARVNGRPVRAQLVSEGELTDDICVPMDMSPRNDSVDDVLVAARLDRDKPTRIAIEKVPGIQAAYQSEITGLDLMRRAGNRRDLAVWTSHNPDCPLLEYDLFSGAVHRLTSFGQTRPAIWEMPMAWFRSCGISKHHYCNLVKEFSLEENGPEAVALYSRSTNPNQRAQSELWLRIPYRHPRPRLEVRLRLEILEQWDDDNVEFTDIFPYPSRLPETWFHQAVLFAQRDRTYVKHNFRPDTSAGSGRASDDPRLFYALYASDRGNVLCLIENLQHSQHPFHYSVCGNYIDIHVNLHPGQVPVPSGKVFEIKYLCELYGDVRTSVDQLRQIGQRSLEAGDIAIE